MHFCQGQSSLNYDLPLAVQIVAYTEFLSSSKFSISGSLSWSTEEKKTQSRSHLAVGGSLILKNLTNFIEH